VSADSEADIASEPMMLIEFAPLIFGTAGLLAIFLFFSFEGTSKRKSRPEAASRFMDQAAINARFDFL
jgi:hypothetical protein